MVDADVGMYQIDLIDLFFTFLDLISISSVFSILML